MLGLEISFDNKKNLFSQDKRPRRMESMETTVYPDISLFPHSIFKVSFESLMAQILKYAKLPNLEQVI